jgi:hypothetical protein
MVLTIVVQFGESAVSRGICSVAVEKRRFLGR